jgi:hypothetical protein
MRTHDDRKDFLDGIDLILRGIRRMDAPPGFRSRRPSLVWAMHGI